MLKSAGSNVACETAPATKAADEMAYFIVSTARTGLGDRKNRQKEPFKCDEKAQRAGRPGEWRRITGKSL